MTSPEAVLWPVRDLVVERFDDAALIWDRRSGMLHHLDHTAATVWDELDGRSVAQVAAALAAVFGVPAGVVEADILTLGNRLLTEGLIRVEGA